MGLRAVFLCGALALACSRTEPRLPVPPGAVAIDETTVGTVEGHRIGVANIWLRSIPKGTAPQPSVSLSIWCVPACDDGADVMAIVGTEIALSGRRYRVIRIDIPEGRPGTVVLRKVDP